MTPWAATRVKRRFRMCNLSGGVTRRTSRLRFAFVAALFALVTATSGNLHALAGSADLAWNAPPECPTRDEVLAEVDRVLAGSREARVPAAANVDVATTVNGRWSAVLRINSRDGQGERRFEADTCMEIASATALILAVTVENGAPPPAPAIAHEEEAAAVSERRAMPEAARSIAPARASQVVAAVAGLVDDGTMPGAPATGMEIALGGSLAFSKGHLRALAGLAFYPTEATAAGSAGESAKVSLMAVSARACALIPWGRFEWGPCLGGEIASMNASGAGPAQTFQPASAHRVWGAATGGVHAAWNYSRLVAVFARAEGVFSLARTRFVLTPDNSVVHEPARVAGRAAVGIELRFF